MAPTCECGQPLSRGGRAAGMRLTCPACGRIYRVVRTPEGLALAARPEREDGTWPADLPSRTEPDMELEEPETDGEIEELLAETGRTEDAPRVKPWDIEAAPEPTAPPVRHSWWYYLAAAWLYPFRGQVKWTLLLLVVAYVFYPLAPVSGYVGALYLLVPLLIVGSLVLYEFEVIRQSGWEGEGQAALPAWGDLVGSVVHSVGLLLAALCVSALPAVAAYLTGLALGGPEWWEAATVAGLLVSLFLAPIHVLAVGMAEDIGALSPKVTLPGLARILLPYTVLCLVAVLTLTPAGIALYLTYLRPWPGLLRMFGAHLLLVYVLTALARALGMLHFAYAVRIGWLREIE